MRKSPFPGMDPYLEPHWLDVHTKLIAYSADALNGTLPDELIARAEERIALESPPDEPRHIAPDVRVFEASGLTAVGIPAAGTATLPAPIRLVALLEPITERYIEIFDRNGERLVTVIEFVSPANKHGKGLQAFRDKRDELLGGGVNFVEIDLIRAGDWRALLRPHSCEPANVSTYRATFRMPQDAFAAYLYPILLRLPLPTVNIPLRADDPPVTLELQPLIEQAYANGRYARTLNYRQPPDPPLEGEDGAWADELLKRAGRR